MSRPRARIAVAVIVIAVLFGAASQLQVVRAARFTLSTSDEETLYLTRRAAGRVLFTNRPLAADLYWIRAIQYYGSRSREAYARATTLEPPPALAAEPPVTFGLLYPLLDITTTLDPRFNIAYRFGAIFLSEEYPHGPGRPDLAIQLLEKAVRAMPDKWQYWQDIGFVYYWNLHDYEKAAGAFERGSQLPGAPWWLRSLAASMLVKGGDRNASRLLWTEMYQTATDETAREAAALKLRQLDALDQIERLQALVDRVSARTRDPVTSWQPLVEAGALAGVPRDPAGVAYEIDDASRVGVSHGSALWPLPVEPGARSGR